MIRNGLQRDRRGVAGAVATMFVLLVVLAFINLYVTGYVPASMRTQEYDHMQQVYGEFSTMQLQNYNLESGKWPYPLTTTVALGTSGDAPFASPTEGQVSFSSTSFSATLNYRLGMPSSMPSSQHTFYENNSGSSTNEIGIQATFQPDTNGTFSSADTGPSGPGSFSPVYYVPENSTVTYAIYSSYVQNTAFSISVGGNGGLSLNNLTLIIYVYGSSNIVAVSGQGNNLSVWYISHGSYNELSDSGNPCGFIFDGRNDMAYVQDYGTGDTAPFGWPQFETIGQYYQLGGSISASVSNQFFTPQSIVYQAGAVILSQRNGAIMQNGPELSAINSSSTGAAVTLNLISMMGENTSASGSGPVSFTSTYFSNRSASISQYLGLNRVNALDLTINSAYAGAWSAFFTQSLSSLQNVSSNPQSALAGYGCVNPPGSAVTWGAYSLSVSGDVLHLSIYNIASLSLEVGYVQTSVS